MDPPDDRPRDFALGIDSGDEGSAGSGIAFAGEAVPGVRRTGGTGGNPGRCLRELLVEKGHCQLAGRTAEDGCSASGDRGEDAEPAQKLRKSSGKTELC